MDTTTPKRLSSPDDAGEVMTPEQVANYLHVGRTYVYELLREKRIPSFTLGKLRRVRKVDVDRYIHERLSDEQVKAGINPYEMPQRGEIGRLEP